MKICFLTYDVNAVGGIERVISVLSHAFTQSFGWNLDIVSVYTDQTKPFFPIDPKVRIIHGHCDNDFSKAQGFVKDYFLNSGENYDFIFTFHLYLAREMARLIRQLPKSCHWIATEHNAIAYYRLKRKLFNLILYRPACRLVLLAKRYEDYYRRFGYRNTCVIHNAVSFESRLSTDFSRKTILAIGRLDPVKRFDLLIEAFSLIASGHPDWKLRILGDGTELSALKEKASSLGISDQVEFPGFCNDIRSELLKGSIFSMSTQNGAECFPMAALEAMECGVPVVSFDMYALREIAGNAECMAFAPFGDCEKLAGELDRVMSDPELITRMGQEAKQRAADFHVEKIAASWKELLESIV